jgi:flagellar motor switch protein FliG
MANPEKLATLGTKNAGRRQTKQNHNIDLCQIVKQTDDSGNVNIINSSILQLAIIYLSYLKQRKYIDVFFNLRSHLILH